MTVIALALEKRVDRLVDGAVDRGCTRRVGPTKNGVLQRGNQRHLETGVEL
jgi:hypothetical protein